MDKSWIKLPRSKHEYLRGCLQFIEYAFRNKPGDTLVACPCIKCVNTCLVGKKDMLDHIVCDGFLKEYTTWVFHGEEIPSRQIASANEVHDDSSEGDHIDSMLHDAFGMHSVDVESESPANDPIEIPAEVRKFYRVCEEGDKELYLGCKYTKLSFVLRLMQLKCMGGTSNKVFEKSLQLIKAALPQPNTLPSTFYEVDKIVRDLGLEYEEIHACRNDCMLYRKEYLHATSCHVCNESRYNVIPMKRSNTRSKLKLGKKVPAKVLRYFPLKPRLQRLFMSSRTAAEMGWHENGRTKDGLLRHPADSAAWKDFDSKHPQFASDPRNVRLGLASDGFNPFGIRTQNTIWPVVLIPYNLPPWLCMKSSNFILSMIIPGKTSPGNNIDVYLQPLIDELNELWTDGVRTYDASKHEMFQLHAALLWTISDLPGYASLSGYMTKGLRGCPHCTDDTHSESLPYSGKTVYRGHRRFLESTHRFRHNAAAFDGTQEFREAPKLLTGSEVLEKVRDLNVTFGKGQPDVRKKGKRGELLSNWTKKSIFFELPYWETNLLRHNLDPMHIEGRLGEGLGYTFLNMAKSKDSDKSRLDLIGMGVRESLQAKGLGEKTYLPAACFNLSPDEQRLLCDFLKSVKFPDGYASNITSCVRVKEKKILGFKTHDWHIFVQHLLPLVIRKITPPAVSGPIIEIANFLKVLCGKVIHIPSLEQMEKRVVIALCQLERIFPPSFFDMIVHLLVHLAEEAKIAGTVHYRWMYPPERFQMVLKSYVRNMALAEGCIAKGWRIEETLTFCSRYLAGVETKLNRLRRNDDGNVAQQHEQFFPQAGRPLGSGQGVNLDYIDYEQAHRFVLFNCGSLDFYIEKHLEEVRNNNRRARTKDIERIHNETFHRWFKNHVWRLLEEGQTVPEEVKLLASGPAWDCKSFKGYLINGYRFHIKDVDEARTTQSSGVMVTAITSRFSSLNDSNPIREDVIYYGVLQQIIELNYGGREKFVLFKCDWADVRHPGRGTKVDEFGSTLVNFNHLLYNGSLSDEPFVFASQVRQVFYVKDPTDTSWQFVVKFTPRDLFEMSAQMDEEEAEEPVAYGLGEFPTMEEFSLNVDEDVSLTRDDIPGRVINKPLWKLLKKKNTATTDVEEAET